MKQNPDELLSTFAFSFILRHYDVVGAAPAVIASLTHAAAAAATAAAADMGTHCGSQGGGSSRDDKDGNAMRAIAATVRELRHRQGLTLVHFSGQREHILSRVVGRFTDIGNKTAQVEQRCGRV